MVIFHYVNRLPEAIRFKGWSVTSWGRLALELWGFTTEHFGTPECLFCQLPHRILRGFGWNMVELDFRKFLSLYKAWGILDTRERLQLSLFLWGECSIPTRPSLVIALQPSPFRCTSQAELLQSAVAMPQHAAVQPLFHASWMDIMWQKCGTGKKHHPHPHYKWVGVHPKVVGSSLLSTHN